MVAVVGGMHVVVVEPMGRLPIGSLGGQQETRR